MAARLSSTHGFRGDFDFVLDVRNFKSTATKFQNGVPSFLYCQYAAEDRSKNAWGLIWSDGLAVKILK